MATSASAPGPRWPLDLSPNIRAAFRQALRTKSSSVRAPNSTRAKPCSTVVFLGIAPPSVLNAVTTNSLSFLANAMLIAEPGGLTGKLMPTLVWFDV